MISNRILYLYIYRFLSHLLSSFVMSISLFKKLIKLSNG
nr:MAG TPA: hypothetical protein [Caudoviricetes sp.]